jgi:putative MATE family efflux protein
MQKTKATVMEMSVWALVWPMFIDLLLSMTLGLEDAYYLAKISDRAAAAVGALLPILGACNMVFQTLAFSGSSVACQLMGGQRFERVNRTFQTMILLNGSLGAVLGLTIFLSHQWIGAGMGLRADIFDMATQFLRLVGPIIFIQAVRFAYSSIVNAHGRPRWNLLAAVLVNILNLLFNQLLTQGAHGIPRLGVTGIALSTIIAQLVGLAVAAGFVHGKLQVRWNFRHYWKQFSTYIKPILSIGIPSAMEPLSFQLNQLVLTRMVVSLGAISLATRTYTLNLIIFAIVWSSSLSLGTQIKIAHFIGARRFQEANAQLHRSLRLGLLAGFCMMVVLSLASTPLFHLFTRDPAIVALGHTLFLLGLLLEPCRASNIVVGISLRASGDARFAALASILITWGIAVPSAYFFAFPLKLGLLGIWLGMIADELLRGLMNYWRWRSGIWQSKGIMVREQSSFVESAG